MLNGVSFAGAPVRIHQAAASLPMSRPAVRFEGGDRFEARQTGIIASLGPASNNPDTIEKMIRAGVGMFRLNFANGTHETHGETIDRVRAVVEKLRESGELTHAVRIMADLQGPRIAVGSMPFTQQLNKGDTVRLSPAGFADAAGVIPTTYPELIASLQPGNRLIVADGKLVLEVLEPASASNGGMALCNVIKGGTLSAGQMINAPEAPLKTPALMEKDIADLEFALSRNVEVITQSYPGSAEDVLEARRRIREAGKHSQLIAKIERPQTVEPDMLRAIARAADGIMVARGDLATETGIHYLPRLQQRIIDAAREEGKYVVVANKLLGSMIENDQPSRSDVFDVVRAVESGADWLMLTGETASGKFPVEAVETAAELIRIYGPGTSPAKPAGKLEAFLEQAREFLYRLVDQTIQAVRQWVGNFGAR